MQGTSGYSPIIRTIDAEIRGVEHLGDDVKDFLLPVFELTRSRPLKNYPEGDIHKRMMQLEEFFGDRPFILDLTSVEDLINDQIEDLLDETDNFREWRNFLDRYAHLNIYPAVHFYEDDFDQLSQMSRMLAEGHDGIAIRLLIETEPNTLRNYLNVLEEARVLDKLHLVIDAQYIYETNFEGVKDRTRQLLEVVAEFDVANVIVASSSFPKSVMDRAGAEDDRGSLNILELPFYSSLVREFSEDINLCYGDYGGAHPIKKSIPGGGWVPRIDVVTAENFNYTRIRRDDGGFKEAARRMVTSNLFDAPECWGKEEIRTAAEDEPNGKSPAYWISVRINQHITRVVQLIRAI